ncbi:MAG: hypothetical protein JWL81_960 [Verrucomicrobiales bacterium]|nr:hypothetical protein [Verrucomicrobiales bacterium]
MSRSRLAHNPDSMSYYAMVSIPGLPLTRTTTKNL